MYAQHIPPAPQPPQLAAAHNARAVHDTAMLRFSDLAPGGKPRWVLARINPTAQSGSAILPGAVIHAGTGRLDIPSGAVASTLKQGSWTPLSPAAGGAGGTYTWTEALEEEKRSLTVEDIYSPFAKGGTIVFVPSAQSMGLAQFGSARLVFDDWASFVDTASRYIVDNRTDVEADGAKLLPMLAHENPLVRLSTLRQLLANRQVTPAIVNRFLAGGGHFASVVAYMIFASSDGRLSETVLQFVSKTHDPARLRPVALGAHAALVFRGPETGVRARATTVLKAVTEQLEPAARSDPYFERLLAK